jgi:hypothetical protein
VNDRTRDLDAFERAWLADAGRDVGGLRQSRAACPPLALLRAAHEDALPQDLHEAVADHVAGCHSCALLQADLAAVPPEIEVSAAVEARILKDIRRKQRAEAGGPALLSAWWSWRSAVAATAIVALGVAAAWQWQQRGTAPAGTAKSTQPAHPSQAAQTAAQPPESTVARMPDAFRVTKPEVRLTLATLAWRGTDDRGQQYLTDLAPALDAFRADRYQDAARLFEPLAAKYPKAVEVPFYLGVSRLFLDDNAGAASALERAAGLKAGGFADDVQWYLGLARARAGDGKGARPHFDALCRLDGPRREAACRAVSELDTQPPK